MTFSWRIPTPAVMFYWRPHLPPLVVGAGALPQLCVAAPLQMSQISTDPDTSASAAGTPSVPVYGLKRTKKSTFFTFSPWKILQPLPHHQWPLLPPRPPCCSLPQCSTSTWPLIHTDSSQSTFSGLSHHSWHDLRIPDGSCGPLFLRSQLFHV